MAKLSTRKRGKKWYYSFDAGTMPDGRRKRVEKGGYRTEKEALAAGTKAMASFLSGNIAIASERISVKEFALLPAYTCDALRRERGSCKRHCREAWPQQHCNHG